MDVRRQFTIGVNGEAATPRVSPLFSALETLFPVEFRPWTNGDCRGLDALILAGEDAAGLHRAVAAGLPVFAVPARPSEPALARSTEFRLENSPTLSACLRGHRFAGHEPIPVTTLQAVAGDDVLASQDGKSIWLRRRLEGTDVTMVAWPLPDFRPDDHIHEHFQPGRFLGLLPLLQFLRNLTCKEDWQSPPAPACLLVDDPSLHSKTYGHLNFRRLSDAAREQDFYVSVATVPLDCWWIDGRVRELFRENAPRVSVLLHGNNHTFDEFARPLPEGEGLEILAQALRRFRRLEHEAGIEVCRVMECPHGTLSVTMLEPMARLGYEAVLATTAHLLRCNGGASFRASLGGDRTLMEKGAVAVIPRIRAEAGWQAEVRLAAFLRQPLILAAHHWDFSAGSHLAEEFAQIVNGLPDACWASPSGVARACYQFLQIGDVLHLEPGARLVDVPIRHPSQWLTIHRPWLAGEPELLVVRAQGKELFRAVSSADVIGPIPLEGSTAVQVSSSVLNEVDCTSVPPPKRRYWPLARKLLVEVRDRSCLRVHLRSQARSVVRYLKKGRRVAAEVS